MYVGCFLSVAIQVIAGPKAGIIEHSVDGSDWVKQDLFVTKNSFRLHLNRIYIPRDGLDPEKEHALTVRISEERHELRTVDPFDCPPFLADRETKLNLNKRTSLCVLDP